MNVFSLRMWPCAFLMPILLSAFKKSQPARMHICRAEMSFHYLKLAVYLWPGCFRRFKKVRIILAAIKDDS